MLQGAHNQSLYSEYYDIILEPDAKRAYLYIIGWAASLKQYDCFPSAHGVIKDFRFMRGNDWDFSFIPNQKWLLFYFRRPCFRFEKYSRQAICAAIPKINETNAGEFTIRITSLDDAVRVSAFIGS